MAQLNDPNRASFEEDFKTSFKSNPKLDIKFDNRFSFIRDSGVKTVGIKVGFNFNRKFKAGLGLNSLVLSGESEIQVNGETVDAKLNYAYFSPYIEYIYYNSKKWEFSLATQLGLGNALFEYDDINGKRQEVDKTIILSYEPATLIDYKIVRWFGIGTGVGYRLVFYKSEGIDQQFSSPEYVIKLKVYLGEIVRTITGKEWQIDD